MAVTPSTKESREVIVTRFVLIYVLAILFALIPMIFLFALPGKAIRELKVSNLSQKGQEKQIERFQAIYSGLDKLLVENRLESDYEYGLFTITRYTKDSIDERSMYKPVFTDVKLLFDHIQKMNKDNPGKVEYEKMKQKSEECEKNKNDLQEKYDKLNEDYIKLKTTMEINSK
jgi:hypothetical protein